MQANLSADDWEGSSTMENWDECREELFPQLFSKRKMMKRYEPGEEIEDRYKGPTSETKGTENSYQGENADNSGVNDGREPCSGYGCHTQLSEAEETVKMLWETILTLWQAWSHTRLEEKKMVKRVWKMMKLCEICLNNQRAKYISEGGGHRKQTNSKSSKRQMMERPACSDYINEDMPWTQEKSDNKVEMRTDKLPPGDERRTKNKKGTRRGQACFQCGEEGHYQRQCSRGKVGSPLTPPPCKTGPRYFKCKEQGHFVSQCQLLRRNRNSRTEPHHSEEAFQMES